MKQIFWFALFIFSTVTLQAQNPGYLGKKFSAGYNFHFYLGGLQNRARTYDAAYRIYQPSIFLNKLNEVHADYVLSKNYSIGLSYQFFKTGQSYHEDGSSRDLNGNYINYTAKNYLNIKGTAIALTNKFYFFKNGTGLAPIGNYLQLGIGAVTASSISKDLITLDSGNSNSIYQTKYVTHESITTPLINIGLGHQTILFDRLIIDVGIEGTFLPGIITASKESYSGNTYEPYPKEIFAHNAVVNRLQGFYISAVKVGMGILLF